MTTITSDNNRRIARINNTRVQLFTVENKRKGPRPVRGGEGIMPSKDDCWKVARLWVDWSRIDFGDRMQ